MKANSGADTAQASHRDDRVLVLIATHNGAAWIAEQLASIAAQRGPVRVTLAVSDDDSTDATLSLVKSCSQAAGLPLQVVTSLLPGKAAGRNFIRLMIEVDASQCDFVALCDQDDVWYPEKLSRAIERLGASCASGYSSTVRAVWPDGRTALMRQSERTTRADHLFEGAGQGCSFVLNGGWFRELQGELRRRVKATFDVHYHDWMLYAMTRSQQKSWFFDDVACLDYRQHALNDTGARASGAGLWKRLALIRSGWYGRQIGAIAHLCAALEDGDGGMARRYLRLLEPRSGFRPLRRFRLALFVALYGRRRWADRTMLVASALAGHLDKSDS